jgi:hypothetical protein
MKRDLLLYLGQKPEDIRIIGILFNRLRTPWFRVLCVSVCGWCEYVPVHCLTLNPKRDLVN